VPLGYRWLSLAPALITGFQFCLLFLYLSFVMCFAFANASISVDYAMSFWLSRAASRSTNAAWMLCENAPQEWNPFADKPGTNGDEGRA